MSKSDDPFFETFVERVGPKLAASFSDTQLDAIKRAFGARQPSRHLVDLRLSVPLFLSRIYFVLLIGRERRQATRLRRALSRVGRVGLAGGLIVMSALAAVLVLYPIKTAAGIDIFNPGGLHEWVIDPLMEQIRRLFGS